MSKALGVFFILFGGVFLLKELGIITAEVSGLIWPILFIVLGVLFLGRKDRSIVDPIEDHVRESIKKSLKEDS